MEDGHDTSLLRSSGRFRSSMGLSCCFGGGHRHGRSLDFDTFPLSPAITPPKSTGLPESRGMFKSSKPRKSQNRRHSSSSTDYSYDPLSYALNFEDPTEADEPTNSFTSRLPLSPPRYWDSIRAPTMSARSSSSEQQKLSRVDAVAEVKKSLEISSREEVHRRMLTPRRPRCVDNYSFRG